MAGPYMGSKLLLGFLYFEKTFMYVHMQHAYHTYHMWPLSVWSVYCMLLVIGLIDMT